MILRFVLPAFLIALATGSALTPSVSLDRPKMSDWPGQTYATAAPLTGWDDPRIRRLPNEPDLAFAERITQTINSATYHCDVKDYEQTVTSYLIRKMNLLTQKDLAQGLLHPSLMRCGFCHQRAFLVAKILDQHGVEDAHVLALVGHVVTAFEIDGVEYVSDPDFGVAPFELETPSLMDRVNARYAGRVSTEGAFKTILAAYADPSDNARYHGGLSRLEVLSQRQAAAARQVFWLFRLTAIGCGALALITGAIGWIMWAKKRKGKPLNF